MRFRKKEVEKMMMAILKEHGKKVLYQDSRFCVTGIESEKLVCDFANALRLDEHDGIFYCGDVVFSGREKNYVIGNWEEQLEKIYDKVVEKNDSRVLGRRWARYSGKNYNQNGIEVNYAGYSRGMTVQVKKGDGCHLVVDTKAGVCSPSEDLDAFLDVIDEQRRIFREREYPEYFNQVGKGEYLTSDKVQQKAWTVVRVLGHDKTIPAEDYCGTEGTRVVSRDASWNGLEISFGEGKETGSLTIIFCGKNVFSSQFVYDLSGNRKNDEEYCCTRFKPDYMIFAPIFVGGKWERVLEELERKATEIEMAMDVEEEGKRLKKIKTFSAECLKYVDHNFNNYTVVDKSHDDETSIEIYEDYFKNSGSFMVPGRRLLFRTEDPYFYEDARWYDDFVREIKHRRGY